MDKTSTREQIRDEFKYFLANVARSGRANGNNFNLGDTSVSSYLSYISESKLFDYAPEKWSHIESIFDVTNPKEIKTIADELLVDEEFKKRDLSNSQGFRSGALMHYVCFINARAFFTHPKAVQKVIEEPSDLQIIFYGAPGTGKSHTVDAVSKKYKHQRITFHPDSDYSSFVGCYKPVSNALKRESAKYDYAGLVFKLKEYITRFGNVTTACASFGYDFHDSIVNMQENGHTLSELLAEGYKPNSTYDSTIRAGMSIFENESISLKPNQIKYEFSPQAFTNAYIEAWLLNAKKERVYLIIEEINRGNCAQIFGDLFQLLDRKDDGYSKYEITPDTELQRHIAKQGLSVSGILDSDGKDISDKINSGELMKLPNNLHIWATMNTSDQSLFPIDSAFKRRWDWVYVPIEEGVDKDTNQKLDWQIEVDENYKPVSWWLFLQKINMIIADLTSSEDKQLGYFFCKPDKEDKKTISKERFVGKVLFYLWNDIFKDYAFDLDICKKAKDNKKVQYFANFYKKQNVIDIDALINFFENLDSSQKEIDDKEVIIFTKKSADSAPELVPTAPEE